MSIYEQILSHKRQHERMLVCLLDPEKTTIGRLPHLKSLLQESEIDYIFVGGSGYEGNLDEYIQTLQGVRPVIIFPGAQTQVSKYADALLFLSISSGKNYDWAFGKQMQTVKFIRQTGIETIGLSYIVLDGGKESAVERFTGCKAIPQTHEQEVVDMALTAQMFGFPMVYLEAGSGAKTPISSAILREVRENISVPLIVGGGIDTQEKLNVAYESGADIVVIGNHFEQYPEDIIRFHK